jgi:hypothetical protein
MRGRALIGASFAALLLALVADNLYHFGRLQRTESCDYTLCLRPRSIESNARENRHPVVSGRYALYHYLARELAGATLTVPVWMADVEADLARVGRVSVRVADAPMRVAPDRAGALRDEATKHLRWLHERKPKKRWRDVHVLVERGASEYVVAEADGELGDLFVLPAARHAEATAP